MPRFEALTYKPLTEVADPTDSIAADYVGEVGAYRLAGVVLRQTHMRHERDQPPAIAGLGRLSTLGVCQEPQRFVVGKPKGPDFGWHRDAVPNGVWKPARRLVTLHNSEAGSPTEVKIIAALPTVQNRQLPRFVADSPAGRQLEEGNVDVELFEPVCYTAELHPNDTLAFIDYRALHNFRTLVVSNEGRTFSVAYYPYMLPSAVAA